MEFLKELIEYAEQEESYLECNAHDPETKAEYEQCKAVLDKAREALRKYESKQKV